MLLIASNSMDGTTDLLLPFLVGRKEVFRFNVDMWRSYQIELTDDGFSIEDPTGRLITERQCSSFYLRKPYFLDEDRIKPAGGDIETWCQYQIRATLDGIYWICKAANKVKLVERNADRRIPKILQLRLAKEYFRVPRWHVTLAPSQAELKGKLVCKPLSSAFVGEYRTMFTSLLEVNDLEDGYPWFLQRYIKADQDITVVYVRGRLFPFGRIKSEGEAIDFKEIEDGQSNGWYPIAISKNLADKITLYMQLLSLDFGRLDFVEKSGDIYFLEVNPNGQYAWLDPDNETGLLEHICSIIVEQD
jgi:hypothetical protein